MFKTSLSPKSVSIYCTSEGIRVLEDAGFARNGDAITVFAELKSDGRIVLYTKQVSGTFRHSFTRSLKKDTFRCQIGAPEKFGLSAESVGGSWRVSPVRHAISHDSTVPFLMLSQVEPEHRLPKDYMPVSRRAKKPSGSTLLAELPDGSTLVIEGLTIAEIMTLQNDMTQRGHSPYVSDTHHIVKD